MNTPIHLAIADIGSTGARFEMVQLRPDGFRRVLRDKVRLDLAGPVFSRGRIEADAEARLGDVLERWREVCERTDARARFVCTSAFRDAQNSNEVVASMERRVGVRLEPLSGEMEARLIARGALPNAGRTGTVAVIDVGGGSTEIAVGRRELCDDAVSLPLGSARFGEASEALMSIGTEAIDALLKRSLPRDFARGAAMALITSGTTRALLRWAAPASSGCLTSAELPARVASLTAMSDQERESVFGDRSHKILPAALILSRVVTRLRVPVLVPCKQGLRHGALLELADQAVLSSV